jgi:uncharacterized peroxidase-related enzyme
MFLHAAPDSPDADRLYQSDRESDGYISNLSRLWAWRPDVCEAFNGLRSVLTQTSSLTRRELGVLVCATASSLGDSYCALAWGKNLAEAADAQSAAAVLSGAAPGAMSPRELALLAWARSISKNPNGTSPKDVGALRAAGFSEREIFEATAYVAFRLAFSTVNDALGARPDWQLAEAVPPEVRKAVTFGRPVAESNADE